MSTGTDPSTPEPQGLQFDRAEFAEAEAPSSVACAGCHRPIADSYFEINGTVFCEQCRGAVEQHFRGGSGVARILRAVVFGSAAALAGAAIYFAVLYYAEMEAALVSILVGYLVGAAVRKGSLGRGGLPYQVLAVFLTYTAIGLAYTASGVAMMLAERPAGAVADRAPGKAARQAPEKAADPKPAEVAPKLDRKEVAALVASMAFALATYTFMAPVLMARQNILSLVIIGFALWRAWQHTRRARFVVTGPYRIGESRGAGPGPGGVAHA